MNTSFNINNLTGYNPYIENLSSETITNSEFLLKFCNSYNHSINKALGFIFLGYIIKITLYILIKKFNLHKYLYFPVEKSEKIYGIINELSDILIFVACAFLWYLSLST